MRGKWIFLALLVLPGWSSAQYDPTDDLIAFFGGSCPLQYGQINASSFLQSGQIKSIISQIESDPACQGITGQLEKIDLLSTSYVLTPAYAEISNDNLERTVQDLELAFRIESARPDPDRLLLGALRAALIQYKVDWVVSNSDPRYLESRLKIDTIVNVQQYLVNVFSQLKVSNACLVNNPNVLVQLGAQLMGLSSTLFGGLFGSALLTAGTLVDQLVSYFRSKELTDQWAAISHARLQKAIGCALESTAATYCRARDVGVVVRSMEENLRNKSEVNPRWKGIELIAQESPSFFSWVVRLNAGSEARSEAQSIEKKDAEDLRASMEKLVHDLNALLFEQRRQFGSNIPDDFRARLVNSMADEMRGNISWFHQGRSRDLPLATAFVQDDECGPLAYLYTLGASRECLRESLGQSCLQCVRTTLLDDPNFIPAIDDIERVTDDLMAEARVFVAQQVSLVRETNPQLVLSMYDSPLQNEVSPREFLLNTYDYLRHLLTLDQYQSGLFRLGVISEINRIEEGFALMSEAEELIEAGLKDQDTLVRSRELLLELSQLFAPFNDDFNVPDAIRNIVAYDLDQMMDAGEVAEDLAVILRLTQGDTVGEFVQTALGMEPARAQAREAKEQTETNLQVLGEVFQDNILDTIEQRQRKWFDSGFNTENAENLALYCMRTLLIPNSKHKKAIDEKCKYLWYNSAFKDAKIYMAYMELYERPFPERVCALYDFERKARIHGLLRNRR